MSELKPNVGEWWICDLTSIMGNGDSRSAYKMNAGLIIAGNVNPIERLYSSCEYDRLVEENKELREHLGNLITESTRLAEFKNKTLRKGICSTDLDEPEWHDYQTIGEAAEYLGKPLNKLEDNQC